MTRARLRDTWPALSRIYGLRPWDFAGPSQLSWDELGAYLTDLQNIARAERS